MFRNIFWRHRVTLYAWKYEQSERTLFNKTEKQNWQQILRVSTRHRIAPESRHGIKNAIYQILIILCCITTAKFVSNEGLKNAARWLEHYSQQIWKCRRGRTPSAVQEAPSVLRARSGQLAATPPAEQCAPVARQRLLFNVIRVLYVCCIPCSNLSGRVCWRRLSETLGIAPVPQYVFWCGVGSR